MSDIHLPPLAVAPCRDLQHSRSSQPAASWQAASSPTPFGLGVMSPDGLPLPLHYVSALAAGGCGGAESGVRAGWYVAARPGERFALSVTLARGGRAQVGGRSLPAGRGVAAELFVDGTRPGAGQYLFPAGSVEGASMNVAGFRESASFADGKANATEVVRPFVFTKRQVVDDAGADDAGETGVVRLRLFVGEILPFKPTACTLTGAARRECGPVAERTAVKLGHALQVGTGSVTKTAATHRASCCVKRESEEDVGVIQLYIRERYWLEARGIIGGQTSESVQTVNAPCKPARKREKATNRIEIIDKTSSVNSDSGSRSSMKRTKAESKSSRRTKRAKKLSVKVPVDE